MEHAARRASSRPDDDLLELIKSRGPGLHHWQDVAEEAWPALGLLQMETGELLRQLLAEGRVEQHDNHVSLPGRAASSEPERPNVVHEATTLEPTVTEKSPQKRFLEQKLHRQLVELGASHAHYKALMCMIGYVGWKTGITYVSVSRVSRESGVSLPWVRAAIKWAQEVGIIVHAERAQCWKPVDRRTAYTFAPGLLSDHFKPEIARGSPQSLYSSDGNSVAIDGN